MGGVGLTAVGTLCHTSPHHPADGTANGDTGWRWVGAGSPRAGLQEEKHKNSYSPFASAASVWQNGCLTADQEAVEVSPRAVQAPGPAQGLCQPLLPAGWLQ